MVRPIEEDRLHVDDREPGIDARLERLADAGIDRLDVLPRNGPAHDLVDELVARALLGGLELDDGMAVLALAAGLTDEAPVALRGTPDGLALGNLRLADIGGDMEFADHPIHEHIQVQFTHARDQGL